MRVAPVTPSPRTTPASNSSRGARAHSPPHINVQRMAASASLRTAAFPTCCLPGALGNVPAARRRFHAASQETPRKRLESARRETHGVEDVRAEGSPRWSAGARQGAPGDHNARIPALLSPTSPRNLTSALPRACLINATQTITYLARSLGRARATHAPTRRSIGARRGAGTRPRAALALQPPSPRNPNCAAGLAPLSHRRRHTPLRAPPFAGAPCRQSDGQTAAGVRVRARPCAIHRSCAARPRATNPL